MAEAAVVLPVTHRQKAPADLNFVLSSWLKSYFKNRQLFFPLKLSEAAYFDGHHALLEALVSRTSLVVACNPDDHGQIYGYLCCDRPAPSRLVWHYLYVKEPYRGFGVARGLMAATRLTTDRVIVTHWTRALLSGKADVKYNLEVNPYYIWRQS